MDLNNIKSSSIIKQKFIENINLPIIKEKLFDNCIILNSSLFLKSEDTFLNLLNILDYNLEINSKVIISFINKDKIKDDIFIKNNEVMYYIQIQTYNQIKLFINGISNESNMTEYCISQNKLIEKFEKNGYKLIPFDVNEKIKSKDFNLIDYEKNICDIYSYCIFEKHENKINKIIEKTDDINIDIEKKTNDIDVNKNININLEYFKISTNYDIFNLLNCINNKYTNLKSLYNIKNIESFEDIYNIFKNTEFLNKIYFIDQNKDIEMSYVNDIVNKTSEGICIYKYKYEEENVKENLEENVEEKITYINYYVILCNNNIVTKKSDIILKFKKPLSLVKKEIHKIKEIEEKEIRKIKEIEEKEIYKIKEIDKNQDFLKISIKNEIKKLDKKITIIKIKEYLKIFNTKTTGNKQELLERLNDILDETKSIL